MAARILIVDDEDYVRDLIRNALEPCGFEIATAASGEEALEELQRAEFDLVLSDVVMPGMEGLELLKQIRKRHPGVKVVILTGYAREQNISDFLLNGAEEYLLKPFQVHELLATVGKLLGSGGPD